MDYVSQRTKSCFEIVSLINKTCSKHIMVPKLDQFCAANIVAGDPAPTHTHPTHTKTHIHTQAHTRTHTPHTHTHTHTEGWGGGLGPRIA